MPTVISIDEVKKHKKKSVWIVIRNDVYDVTSFLKEHPGGEETILEVAGTDATQAFEDVGHSEDARTLLKKYKIGSLPASETSGTGWEGGAGGGTWKWALLALGVVILGALAYKKFAAS